MYRCRTLPLYRVLLPIIPACEAAFFDFGMTTLWKRFLLNPNNTYSAYRSARSLCFSQCCSIQSASTDDSLEVDAEEFAIQESERNISVLEEQSKLEDVSYIGPAIDQRSFNFGAFVNHSHVLRKLVDLGVNFYKIEKNIQKPDYLIQLNFETDVQPHIQFLLDKGVPVERLGRFFTENPYFFQNSLDDLQIRINYLESKKFKPDGIAEILTHNPRWLNYPTVEMDKKLGFFQRTFRLSGYEVRLVTVKYPALITSRPDIVKNNLFELREVNEFTLDECKVILLKSPVVWTLKPEILKQRLEVMTIDMELPRELIIADPSGLETRHSRMRTRHLYLKSLCKAQYDPKRPNYISIQMITHGDDATFCELVAKTPVESFNLFLKTL